MKLSLNWIKDYIDLPAELGLDRIAYDLTMATVEVEGWREIAKDFEKMVVGVIKGLEKHPSADKLTVCKVDCGAEIGMREIVCGGSNLAEGMKVAVALPGAKVRWHGEGDLVEIKAAKLRGVESYGMICASSEIGLFDLFPFEDEATIVDLSAFSAKAGTPLAEALGLDDVILEIDNKSLTNRPDLWGHYGIARELSALYDLELKEIEARDVGGAKMKIEIADEERCPRYIGVQMEGLAVKPAPFEMQRRLWSVGQRPINAIVDITNYVMASTGQPTHAFDSDNIAGHITVRRAKDGEKLLLLNGKELELSSDDLVIADAEGAVGLAGVMGGAKDSVLPSTDKVILEIANFEATGIRSTAARHENRTDAAIRYEKAIDPERCEQALALAMAMFADVYPEMKVAAFSDNYPAEAKRSEVDVSLAWLEKRLGKRIPNEEIARLLGRLGFEMTFKGDNMHVIAPTWRSTGDISIPDDIMEEVARLYGFENFEPVPIVTSFDGAINQLEVDIDRKIREYLAFRCGMNEVFTYPWVSDEYIDAVMGSNDGMLSLASPPSPSEKYVRNSLVMNLCKAVAGNLRFEHEFAIFESAQVFVDGGFSAEHDEREELPWQRRNIAGACVGDASDVNGLFRKAKGIIEAMPRAVHMEGIEFVQEEKPAWADNVVWLNIKHGGAVIGNLALLAKKAAMDCGIKNSAVMLFEMDIDCLKPLASRTNKFEHLPEYPVVDYDVSLLFDVAVNWGEIEEVITAKKYELLKGVSFVDEYSGKQIPDGKKSVTFRLVIGSDEKTLNSGEIEGCAKAIIKRLQKSLQAEMRG